MEVIIFSFNGIFVTFSTTKCITSFQPGIRVQLDANVKLRFQSKVDNRLSTNWAISSILQDAPEPDEGNYVLSPLRVQILGNGHSFFANLSLIFLLARLSHCFCSYLLQRMTSTTLINHVRWSLEAMLTPLLSTCQVKPYQPHLDLNLDLSNST